MFDTTSLLLIKDLKSVLRLATRAFFLSAKESPCILHYVMEFGRRNSWGDGIKMRDIIPSRCFFDYSSIREVKTMSESGETSIKR
jgi:hypothetical protein